MGVSQLVNDEPDECDGRDGRKYHDVSGAEPVVLLALVEDDLQESEADDDEREAEVVHLDALALTAAQPRRIFDDHRGEKEGEQPDGDVDEENPTPVVVVGNPATERGTYGGSHHNCHAEDGEGLASFFGRESVGEDGLLAGTHASAASALEDTEEDEQGQGGSESTEE